MTSLWRHFRSQTGIQTGILLLLTEPKCMGLKSDTETKPSSLRPRSRPNLAFDLETNISACWSCCRLRRSRRTLKSTSSWCSGPSVCSPATGLLFSLIWLISLNMICHLLCLFPVANDGTLFVRKKLGFRVKLSIGLLGWLVLVVAAAHWPLVTGATLC